MDDTIFDLKYSDSISPLSRASISGDVKLVKKLLLSGKLPQATDNRGWTSLHYCVASSQLKVLKVILKLKSKNKKYLVNLASWENVTPLLLALKIESPSIEIVKVLLNAGANPQLSTHTKLSPLHVACLKKGNVDIVKLLVQHGADINAQEDLFSNTPLHFAITKACDLDMIKFLVENSDLKIKNSYNRTAFFECCITGFTEAVVLFLNVDKNLVNDCGDVPPLLHAAFSGNVQMAKLLLEAGASTNVVCDQAFVSDPSSSDGLILEAEKYLPIHSSLINLEVFKLILDLTNPTDILNLSSSICEFPLFVLIYAKDINFYEFILQSHLPEELKKIKCRSLCNFILNCSWQMSTVIKKFKLCFKYNFYLEPEDVFQNFLCVLSNEEISKNVEILYQLAELGISSGDQFTNKASALKILENLKEEDLSIDRYRLVRETCVMLNEPVLSLKQLARIIVRRHVRVFVQTDWAAYKMVQESKLPDSLRKYLLFQL